MLSTTFRLRRWDWLLLFVPTIVMYASLGILELVCKASTKMKNAGNNVKFRPPGWVFGVIWPVLYLLLGFALVQVKNSVTYIVVLSLLLASFISWIYLYSCKSKKAAIFNLLVSLMLGIMLFSYSQSVGFLVSPLIGWLIFALILSTTDFM